MDNIKYIVKPEEKMVIGLYEIEIPEILNYTDHMKLCEHNIIIDIMSNSGMLCRDVTVKAIARCSGNDEFDVEFGKKLVAAKICKKRKEIIMKHCAKISDILTILANKVYEIGLRNSEKYEYISKDLVDYFGLRGE